MGNSKSEVECALKMDKQFYYAGQSVAGQVYLSVRKQFLCSRVLLLIEGIEQAQFGSGGNTLRGHTDLLKTVAILHQFPKGGILLGQYVFPFEFILPNYLPGSYYERKEQYKASIRYCCRVVLVNAVDEGKNYELQREIVVREPQKEQAEMLYGEMIAYPRTCFCLRKGVSRISCYFEKNFYFSGDECVMICEADNTKCEVGIESIRCDLTKAVTLTSYKGEQSTHTEVINTVNFPGLRPHHAYVAQDAQRQKIKLFKRKGDTIEPSTSGKIVKCQYYIRVGPIFQGWCRGNQNCCFSVKVNILQVHPETIIIQKPKDWDPQVYPDSKIFLAPSNINDKLQNMPSYTKFYPQ